jgi:hypothetical protein
MVYREIRLIAVSSENRTEHKNTHLGQDVQFCEHKTGFHKEIAGRLRFKYLRNLPFVLVLLVYEILDGADFTTAITVTAAISASALWTCNMLPHVFHEKRN